MPYKPVKPQAPYNFDYERRELRNRLQRDSDSTIFVGGGRFGRDLSTFTRQQGEDRISNAALYGFPGGRILGTTRTMADEILAQSDANTELLVNQEYNDYLNSFSDNTFAVNRFGDRFEKVTKGSVHRTRYQLHAKTLLKTMDGVETLFLGTGNFTAGAMHTDPYQHTLANKSAVVKDFYAAGSKLSGAAINLTGAITNPIANTAMAAAQAVGASDRDAASFNLHHEAMTQVNFAVITQNKAIIQEYKEVIQDVITGKVDGDEYDHFVVGGVGGKSREKYLDFIGGAKSKVDVISPFIDDMAMADALVAKAKSGVDVRVLTLPFESLYKKGAGGSIKQRLEFAERAYRGGVKLYMADVNERVMLHSKAVAVDQSEAIISSHNLTRKAFEESIELGLRTDMGDQVSNELDKLINHGIVKEVSIDKDSRDGAYRAGIRLLRQKIISSGLSAKGMLNETYAGVLADEYSSFTISASAGSSYHYGKALHNTLMNQAGYYNLARSQPVMGVMESTMRANAMLMDPDGEAEISNWQIAAARLFDTGVNTAAAGMWLNENIFLPSGWGRVYKDELGAIPSFAALAGRVLDEGYLYYTTVNPDYAMIGSEVHRGLGFNAIDDTGRKEGLFETTFGKASELLVASAQSLGLYMAVSQPIEIMKASMNQNYLESALQDAFARKGVLQLDVASPDKVKYVQGVDDRIRNINSLTSQLFDKTPRNPIGVEQSKNLAGRMFGDVFSTDAHLFGRGIVSQSTKPGGIAAAIMTHAYESQKVGLNFFEYTDQPGLRTHLIRSTYTTMLQIQRGRGINILEGVFRPFLEDFINPFDPKGPKHQFAEGALNYYDYFQRNIDKLMKSIGQAPDIAFEIVKPVQYFSFGLAREDVAKIEISTDPQTNLRKLKININKRRGGGNKFDLDEVLRMGKVGKATTITSFQDLMERHTADYNLYNKELVKVGKNIRRVERVISNIRSKQSGIPGGKLDAAQRGTLKRAGQKLVDMKYQQRILKNATMQYMGQLEAAQGHIFASLRGVGVSYKMSVSANMQAVLDLIPLNPFKWGMFGGRLANPEDAMMFGEIFSFHKAAQLVEQAVTGENVLKRILFNSQHLVIEEQGSMIATVAEKVTERKKILSSVYGPLEAHQVKKIQDLDNDIKSLQDTIDTRKGAYQAAKRAIQDRAISFDSSVDEFFKYVKEQNVHARQFTRIVGGIEKGFRKFEKGVVNSGGKFGLLAHDGAVHSKTTTKGAVQNFIENGDARLGITGLKGKSLSASMDDLIDAAVNYNKIMASAAGMGLDANFLARAAETSKVVNVSDTVSRVHKGTMKNLMAEMFIFKKTELLAGLVFSSIALNNAMQSTGGASLVSQFGAMLAGAGYDATVEARGNKILPISEVTNQLFGWDPTVVNTLVETGTVAGALYVGRIIAKNSNNLGYLVQHHSEDMVREALEAGNQVMYFKRKVLDKKGKVINEVLEQVDIHNVAKMFGDGSKAFGADVVDGGVNMVYIGKRGLKPQSTDELLRYTVLSDRTFRTDAFLREVTENLGTKTMIYGTFALLALGGARNTIATALNALSDNQGWAEGMYTTAGMAAGGFALGAVLQMMGSRGRMASAVNAEGVNIGASLMQKAIGRGATAVNPMMTAAILGAAGIGLGLYRMTRKGMFEDTPGGSLDPLIAGTMGAFAVGVLTKSAAGALIGATVAGMAASTLNWAGIKFTRTGSRGAVSDINSQREVAQLGYFASAVLDNEKSVAVETLAAAAFAAQYAKGKSILSKEFNDVGMDVKVVARQSPLPFLQFFVAERVKGKGNHGTGFSNPVAGDGTTTTYSIGVQTGPLLGTSLAIELPVMYTPKKGFMNLTYNPDSNLLGLYEKTATVGAWAGLTLGSMQIGANMYGRLFKALGMFGLDQAANNMFDISRSLGRHNEFIFSATAKINSVATTTLLRTATGLWGADARLLYQMAVKSTTFSDEVIEMAIKVSNISELENLRQAGKISTQFFDKVIDARERMGKNLETAGEGIDGNMAKQARWYARAAAGSRFFMGALLVGGATYAAISAINLFQIESSKDAYEANKRAAEWDQAKQAAMMVATAAGVLGGVTNTMLGNIRVINTGGSGQAAKYIVGYETSFGGLRMWDQDKAQAKVAMQFYKAGLRTRNLVGNLAGQTKAGKLTRFALTVGAIWASQYMRIDSDFGLVKYMDSHIIYKDRKLDPEIRNGSTGYKNSMMHQALVSGGLATIYSGAYWFAGSPLATQQETIINFARVYNADIAKKTTRGVMLRAADKLTPGFIKNYRTVGRDGLVLDMLQRVNQQAVKFMSQDGKINPQVMQDAINEAAKLGKLAPWSDADVAWAKAINEIGVDDVKAFRAAWIKVKRATPKELAALTDEKAIVDNVTKKLYKMAMADPSSALGQNFKAFQGLVKGRSLKRFGTRIAGAFALVKTVQMAGRWLADQGGVAGGPVGMNTYLDRLFDQAAKAGMVGQEKGKHKTTLVEGAPMIFSDVLRIFLGRDRVDLTLVDHFNRTKSHKSDKLFEAPVVGTYKQFRQGMNDMKVLQDMLIVDKSNAYMAALDFGGYTIRRGERGVYTSTYFQLQGTGHDVSTASYSMAAKWIFKDYIAGRGHTSRLVDNAVGGFKAGMFDIDDAATMIRNVTAQSFALKESRKYSRMSGETEAALSGDSLMRSVIRARQSELEHIAWQPVDSLFTNMFFEATEKAKRQLDGDSYARFLMGVAQGDKGQMNDKNFHFMEMYANLMQEGAFQNYLQNSFIKNVVFFGGSGSRNKARNAQQVQAYADLWIDQTSLSHEMELYKQARPLVDEWFQESVIDDIVTPLTTTGMLSFMPKPVLAVAGSAVVAGVGLWTSLSVTKMVKAKQFTDSVRENIRFWGPKPAYQRKYRTDVNNVLSADLESAVRLKNMSIDEWLTAKRADRKLIGSTIGSAYAGKGPANVLERLPGVKMNKYILTVDNGMSTVQFNMSSQIDDIVGIFDKAGGAIAPKGQTYIDTFLNIVEKYGNAMKTMTTILDPQNPNGALSMISAAGVGANGKAQLGNIVDEAFKALGRTQGRAGIEWIGELASANIGKADLARELGNSIRNRLVGTGQKGHKGILESFLDNIFDEELLKVKVTTSKGTEAYLFQLMSDTLDADGAMTKFPSGMTIDQSKVANTGNRTLAQGDYVLQELRRQQKRWMQEIVDEVLSEQIDASGRFIIRDIGVEGMNAHTIESQVEYLMERIMTKIRSSSKMTELLQTNGGIFKGGDIVNEASKRQMINEMIEHNTRRAAKTAMRQIVDGTDALQYSKFVKIGMSGLVGTAAKTTLTAFGIMSDFFFGLDFYGAYMRTLEASVSPFATDLDKDMAYRELGQATLTSLMGVAQTLVGMKLIKGGGKLFKFVKKHWKGAAVGTAALAIGGKPLYDNFVKPMFHRAGRFFEENEAMKNAGKWMRANTGMIEEGIGRALYMPSELAGKLTGSIGVSIGFDYEQSNIIGQKFMAGGLAAVGATALIGGGYLMSGGAAAAAAGSIALGPIIAGVLLGAFVIGGAASVIGSEKLTEWSTLAIREAKNLPFIGEWMAGFMTDPYRASRDKASRDFYAMLQDSPFQLGYIGDIVNRNWLRVVSAADEPSGSDMVGVLFGNVLDTGTNINPAWRRNAASGMIGGPAPIVDQKVERELKIRAQRYSDEVIGNYSWGEMRRFSDSSYRVEAAEARVRKYKATQRELYRAALLSSALKSSNNVANVSKNILNAQRANQELDKAIARAKHDNKNEGKQITQGVMTVATSSIKNNVEDHNTEAMQQAVGTPGAEPRYDKEYKGQTGFGDDNSVFVNFEVSTAGINDLTTAHIQGLTGAVADNSFDSQKVADNLRTTESLLSANT